jgi:hypothetical protein
MADPLEQPNPTIINELKKAATATAGILPTAAQGANQITGSTMTAVNNAINTFDNLQGVVKTTANESTAQIENLSKVASDLENSIGSAGSTVITASGAAVGSVISESGAAAKEAFGTVKHSINEGSKSITCFR